MGPTCAVETFRRLFLFFSFIFINHRVQSDFTYKPMDSECLVNESTFFNCSSNITARECHWYHIPVGFEAHERKSVYAFGKIYKDYEEDFVLENNSNTLVIRSVKPSYAGEYQCQEDGGTGGSAYAELIVLDDEPECNSNINPYGVIGLNACGIQPDELHLSCSISYHGNICPTLMWTTLGENDSIGVNATREQSHGRVTYKLTIKAALIKDKSSYECQTTNSRTSKHSCTSESVKLLYVFAASSVSVKKIGDVVNCSANTSIQSCQYKWRWYNKEDLSTVSNNRILKVNRTGQHRCEATCDLRRIQCTVDASFINATLELSISDSSDSAATSVWMPIVVAVFICLLVAVLIFIFVICRRKRGRKESAKAEKKMEMKDGRYPVGETSTEEGNSLLEIAADDQPLTLQGEEMQSTSSASPISKRSKRPEQLNLQMTSPHEQEQLLNSDQSEVVTNITANPADREESHDEVNIDKGYEESTEEKPNEESLVRKAIETHRPFLKQHMDPDSDLLDILRANMVLSGEEISKVKGKDSFYTRNYQLLDYILEKDQCSGLIAALRDSGQIHIVNYLNSNGVHDTKYGNEWPLTEKEMLILDTNQKSFIELLNLRDLLSYLHSSKVINARQMDIIFSEPVTFRKTELLLDILRRRSLYDYMQMIICLHQSNQRDIANVLESGGVIMKLHSHLDGPSETVDMAEEEISTRFANELSDKTLEVCARILERLNLKVIAAKKEQSIVLYIWCETEKGLLCLHEFLTNGHLKDPVEKFFHQFLTPSQKVTVKNITIDGEDFTRLKKYFADDIQRQMESPGSPAIQVIPLTLDRALIRSSDCLNSSDGESGPLATCM